MESRSNPKPLSGLDRRMRNAARFWTARNAFGAAAFDRAARFNSGRGLPQSKTQAQSVHNDPFNSHRHLNCSPVLYSSSSILLLQLCAFASLR